MNRQPTAYEQPNCVVWLALCFVMSDLYCADQLHNCVLDKEEKVREEAVKVLMETAQDNIKVLPKMVR